MIWSRRDFLASAAAVVTRQPAAYFGLHPFIEANPKAVFIRRTNVPHKMDAESQTARGAAAGARDLRADGIRRASRSRDRIILKPNITQRAERSAPRWRIGGRARIRDFYEGLVMGLKELGLKKFHFAEANIYSRGTTAASWTSTSGMGWR